MAPTARYEEMQRTVHILGNGPFACTPAEMHQAIWDAIRAYTIVMQLDNPKEIFQKKYSGSNVPEQLKADLRRLWIGPDIEPDDPRPF